MTLRGGHRQVKLLRPCLLEAKLEGYRELRFWRGHPGIVWLVCEFASGGSIPGPAGLVLALPVLLGGRTDKLACKYVIFYVRCAKDCGFKCRLACVRESWYMTSWSWFRR